MSDLDWQWPDPDAYDPDNPLALLEKAAGAGDDNQTTAAVWALRSMLAARADAGVMIVARDFVRRSKVLPLSQFDRLERERAGGEVDGGDRGPVQSEILARYAQERFTLHRDGDDQPYALPKDGPPVARYLRGGRSLRAQLAATYLLEHGRPPSSSALADALGAVEGLALSAEVTETAIRAARWGDAVYLDLGADDGSAVRISGEGWLVTTDCPVVWHRTSRAGQLPGPARGGDLDKDLWQLARVPEPLRPLGAAWICCVLLRLVTPILDISGEHGSGKTSAATVISNVIDTGKPGGPPGNAVDLVVAAARRMIVLLDNLEDLPPWLAATLCRLVTGEELSRRALFTDSDEVLLSLRRPVITTSIDMGAQPSDYADRLVRMEIPVLSEDKSMSEEEWAASWEEARPRAMGAVLDLAAKVMAVLPGIRLERTPRMGDYARVLAAVDQVLGTDGLATYRAQRAKSEAATAESDAVGAALLAWLPDKPHSWKGSMTALLAAITPDTEPRGWPRTPRALQARLAKLAKPLRRVGITVSTDDTKEPGTRRTLWQIERVAATSFNPSDASGLGSDQAKQGEGSQPPDADPTHILRPDNPPDLRESPTKDVKDSDGAFSAACARHTRFGPHPRCLNCKELQ